MCTCENTCLPCKCRARQSELWKLCKTRTILSQFNILWTCLILVMLLPISTLADIYKIPLRISRSLVKGQVQLTEQHELSSDYDGNTGGNLSGKPGQGYYIEMHVGTPPQKLSVLVDTGSSNFAIASAPHPDITTYFMREQSSTFTDIGTEVYVPYTQGNWKGPLGRDKVSISSLPNVAVTSYFACITESSQFFINGSNWQGILGLAYAEIARPNSDVEPYFDSLVSHSGINNTFSMQLCGTVDTQNSTDISMGGTLVIGGIDESLYHGDIFYSPLYREWYYQVIVTDIHVGQEKINMDCKEFNFDKTIVDSGTTNLRLPHKVYHKVVQLIRDQTTLNVNAPEAFWEGKQILCWAEGVVPWSAFPQLSITLAESDNSTFQLEISPQQYLRAVGDEYDVTAQNDCFKFAVATSDTGTVLGAVIMEGYYVIFDRANKRMGFAHTTCKPLDPNYKTSVIKGPFTASSPTTECAYVKIENQQSALMIVAYVMAGVCGLCLLPLVLLVLQWQYRQCRGKQESETADDTDLLKEER